MRFFLYAAAVALLASTLAARADTVYTYTGPNFTSVTGPFTTSESVQGTVTFATPLTANLNRTMVTPTTFFFQDGVDSFTPANTTSDPINTYFVFSTNQVGQIVEFKFFPQNYNDFVNLDARNFDGVHSEAASGYGSASSQTSGSFNAGVSGSPIAVTSEPSSIALLGTGLLGVAGVLRKRFA